MHRLLLIALVLIPSLKACETKSADSMLNGFTGDVRMVTPFTQPSVNNGKLYLSRGRLRVDMGPMTDIYIVAQKKGWRIFAAGKQYSNIGEKQVSTYMPPMTAGSPCPNADIPSACKMVDRENLDGRAATKWDVVSQHGEHVYLWTDDKLEVALRWEIENVTYELKNIHETELGGSMFELPPNYMHNPEFDFGK